jgi:Coenzyme PQQ synthesis protein D (PqqD)
VDLRTRLGVGAPNRFVDAVLTDATIGAVTGTECLRPSPDVVHRRVDDEIVLVHLGTNRIFSLNRTAGRLWELLEDTAGRAELHRRLLEEFDVEPAQLDAELEGILSAMTAEGLLQTDAEA